MSVVRVGWTSGLGEHFQPSNVVAYGWHKHPLSLVTVKVHKVLNALHMLATLLTNTKALQSFFKTYIYS